MDFEYRVYVNAKAFEVLPKSGRKREAVREFIHSLSDSTRHQGDFTVPDTESGRPFQVTVVSGFAITWWVDGAVDEVKVVDIRPLELRD